MAGWSSWWGGLVGAAAQLARDTVPRFMRPALLLPRQPAACSPCTGTARTRGARARTSRARTCWHACKQEPSTAQEGCRCGKGWMAVQIAVGRSRTSVWGRRLRRRYRRQGDVARYWRFLANLSQCTAVRMCLARQGVGRERHLHSFSFSSTWAQKSRDTMSMFPAAISSCKIATSEHDVSKGTAACLPRPGRAGSATKERRRRALGFQGHAPDRCRQSPPIFQPADSILTHHGRLHLRLAPSHRAQLPLFLLSHKNLEAGPDVDLLQGCRVFPRCWGTPQSLNSLPTRVTVALMYGSSPTPSRRDHQLTGELERLLEWWQAQQGSAATIEEGCDMVVLATASDQFQAIGASPNFPNSLSSRTQCPLPFLQLLLPY